MFSSTQVKLGRSAPLEEGGEETVSMANLELLKELQAAALECGDWPVAISKVNIFVDFHRAQLIFVCS
jgi:hypothetical protein